MLKVLISDKMSPLAAQIFEERGVEVDVKTGMSHEELLNCIDQYDGLAVRSSTKVTEDLLTAGADLKVIGRAGIGVDNIDVGAATAAGICVMNTPFGNSITTAELAISMIMSLSRQIPRANASTHAGKWEKSKFMGVEIMGKTLGIIGCGNVGAVVADRAQGLKMRVISYDPYLSPERALELGIEKVELDELFSRADFISLHTPLTDATRNIINADAIAKMKPGMRIVNCARGGLIVEKDLKVGLLGGQIAAAGLDVFAEEPAQENILFGMENVVCTPHLGAARSEAQFNVAIQVAEQMADYLVNGAITNALNMPSISAEDAPRLKPYLKLAEQLGEFAGQITDNSIKKIEIEYEGTVTDINTDPITSVLISHLLSSQMDSVNMVNALQVAESRGIQIKQSYDDKPKEWRSMINLIVTTEKRVRNITGTLFTGREPRIVNIEGVPIEAALTNHMLFIRNNDQPGMIGALGTTLADAGHNIADFRLGRKDDSTAICLVSLDEAVPDKLFKDIESLPHIKSVKRLSF